MTHLSKLSITNLMVKPPSTWFKKSIISLADAILCIKQLSKRYHAMGLAGLEKVAFTEAFIQQLDLRVETADANLLNVPKSGAAIVVANHPFGGIEGIVLANILSTVRPDVKILANKALKIFPELADFFIFTNPLSTGAKGNLSSLRQCQQHLEKGGLLVIFPAGRVSYPETIFSPITDHPWNRLVGSLMNKFLCPVIPCFIGGRNRKRFYWLGHIYFRLRLLMLIREMLASDKKNIPITFGKALQIKSAQGNIQMSTDLTRLSTYLLDPIYRQKWPETSAKKTPEAMQPLAKSQAKGQLSKEVDALAKAQQLVHYKSYVVCYATRAQCPSVVEEIRKLREASFRLLDEGSGNPQDGDDFDDTYTHLFIFDQKNQSIIGAYRMGQTDKLLKTDGMKSLYLSKMFNFDTAFINQQQACLEMGRSFIVLAHQRSFHGLLLLFKGISAFIAQHPQYRVLYGTVSLSKQYDPLSVLLIEQFLVTKTDKVMAKESFKHPIHHELLSYLKHNPKDIETLDTLIKQIEPDGKGLPVLVKQYHQLGATFHCVAIDPNFASTPGLLLSVDVPSAPKRLLKLYLGDKLEGYLAKVNANTSS